MNDGRHDPETMDEMDELLSLADGPVHFPEPGRRELLDQVIRTASMSRVEAATIVPIITAERAGDAPRRTWIAGVAASVVLIIAVASVVVMRQGDRSQAPADPILAVPMVDEVCEMLAPLAAANGLDQGPVQVGDVSLDDLDEVRRLLAPLSVDDGGPVDSELIDDAVTRIQLMGISIDASNTSAAASAMTAARASVGAVIDEAC